MTGNTTRREAQRRFLEILAEAELAPPDEIHWEDEATVFLWNELKFAVYLDPDRDDVGPARRAGGGATARTPSRRMAIANRERLPQLRTWYD